MPACLMYVCNYQISEIYIFFFGMRKSFMDTLDSSVGKYVIGSAGLVYPKTTSARSQYCPDSAVLSANYGL